MIISLPLDKLSASPRNVRRATDAAADLQLKADIAARGLIQNLVVTKAKKPKGRYLVEAGNRRLAALQALAAEGGIAPDHDVACLVVDADAAMAREVGLAENFQRLAMSAADECLAFGQLIAEGADIESVARRFGLTVRFVEGRLRLADLAPEVFDALSRGAISLDVAKAYAVSADRERQAYVFEQLSSGYGGSSPDTIRRLMTQASARAGDRRALFVGEDAYVAAGGRIERDLFAEQADARWLDIALLDRLTSEKLAGLAEAAAAEQGLAFVRPVCEPWIGAEHVEGLQRLELSPAPLTDAENERLDTLEAEIERNIAILEDENSEDAERNAAEAAIREASDASRAIADRPPEIAPELKQVAGTFLLIDERGRAALHPAYYEPATGVMAGEPEGTDADRAGEAPVKPERGLSQRLTDELAMQRRDILAVHVAADPALALDLAIFLMVEGAGPRSFEYTGFALRAGPTADPVPGLETPDAAATAARKQAEEALDKGWLDGETLTARFDAFRGLSEQDRAAWLGHAVASTLEASLGGAARRCAFHDHLGGLLGIDVAAWWRPTGANYFDRIPKATALEALAAVGGAELARRYDKAKKAELAQSCERIFAGDFIAEVAVKATARAWLPDVMRFQPEAHLVENAEQNDLDLAGTSGSMQSDDSPDAAQADVAVTGDVDASAGDGMLQSDPDDPARNGAGDTPESEAA